MSYKKMTNQVLWQLIIYNEQKLDEENQTKMVIKKEQDWRVAWKVFVLVINDTLDLCQKMPDKILQESYQ